MAASASLTQSTSGNCPAAPSSGDGTSPSRAQQRRTLNDIRTSPAALDRELGTFPPHTPEQTQALKLARKDVIEFYAALTEKSKSWFLGHGNLENVDLELWLELLEPHLGKLGVSSEGYGLSLQLQSSLKYGQTDRDRVCREIICTSDLAISTKLHFLGKSDRNLRMLVAHAVADSRDARTRQLFKQHIQDEASHEREFWLRAGVLTPRDYCQPVLRLQDISQLSPAMITKLGRQQVELTLLGQGEPATLNALEEKLSLLDKKLFDFDRAKEQIAAKRAACASAEVPIDPTITDLWRTACEDAGISPPFALPNWDTLGNPWVSGDPWRDTREFLTWWNAQGTQKYSLNTEQIVQAFYETHQPDVLTAPLVLATLLSRDSLVVKCSHLDNSIGIPSFNRAVILALVNTTTPPPVPEKTDGLALMFDRYHSCLQPWLRQRQDDFLTLLERCLPEAKNNFHPVFLHDIEVVARLLREYKPTECDKILKTIAALPQHNEYEDSPVLHRAVVNSSYHNVLSIPTPGLSIRDETTLYNPQRLFITVPAGNRWIFLEGLKAPEHQVLHDACTLLEEIISNELRVNPSERVPHTDSRMQKISATLGQLKAIDTTSLSETNAIFHNALVPLFDKLLRWRQGKQADIQTIVDIEHSGLARHADPTDTIRIAPGNFLEFIQKKQQQNDSPYLSRDCPVLDQERFKRNLLVMAQIRAETLSKRRPQGRASSSVVAEHQLIPPEIPPLDPNPAVLYRLSQRLLDANQYLTTSLASHMNEDYSYEPLLPGPLADFIAKIKSDPAGPAVRLSTDLAGHGTILPCPHHGSIDPGSVASVLEDIKVAQRPDGTSFIQGGAGFAEFTVTMRGAQAIFDLNSTVTISRVRNYLPTEIYNQLTSPIAPLAELPSALQKAIRRARMMTVTNAASYLQDFVQKKYVYSFDAANSDAYRAFQEERARGATTDHNAYLRMIHALGDGECLGKGVCGQLSTVLLASLRLAGVPSLMTQGYLATEQEIDSNMRHAYVSVLLPRNDGTWRLKPVEATRGGVEELILMHKHEQQRLQTAHAHTTRALHDLEQLTTPQVQTNKWAWLAPDLGDAVLTLTDRDAEIFYAAYCRCREKQLMSVATDSPTTTHIADAYAVLLGSPDDLAERVHHELHGHPHLQEFVRQTITRRNQILERIEASLAEGMLGGGE